MKQTTINSTISDISASIVVFLVALPLCLGIALGSQAPLTSGLVAGVIGGIVVGALSGSALSVSGPAAGLIAIVIMALQTLGSFEAFLLAVLLAGVMQIIFGIMRLGTLGDFIPNAVIKGMLAAIGLILIIKQIPHFFGYQNLPGIDEDSLVLTDHRDSFNEVLGVFGHISTTATSIAIISLLILIIFEFNFIKKHKKLKMIPAPLIAVIVGALINHFIGLNNPDSALQAKHLVSLGTSKSENLFDLSSFFIAPDFSQIANPDIWVTAFTIALVASVETLLCIEAVDRVDRFKRRTPTNRELKAQGVGNIVAGLVGGLPITSVIVRSSANANAGAATKASAILHGVWLALAIILIPDLINKIPYSALAAILIFTGFKLANPRIFKDLYKLGKDQIIPFIITISAILATNLLLGIFIGILVSIIFILHSNFNSSMMVVAEGNSYLMRFRKDVSFLNKSKVKTTLESLPKSSRLVIDISKTDFIDKDVIEVINDFRKHAHLKRIRVTVKKNDFNNLHKLIK